MMLQCRQIKPCISLIYDDVLEYGEWDEVVHCLGVSGGVAAVVWESDVDGGKDKEGFCAWGW